MQATPLIKSRIDLFGGHHFLKAAPRQERPGKLGSRHFVGTLEFCDPAQLRASQTSQTSISLERLLGLIFVCGTSYYECYLKETANPSDVTNFRYFDDWPGRIMFSPSNPHYLNRYENGF
jgi:hypothetical protein